MNHLTAEQLDGYLLDDLGPEASAGVEQHLRECADCTARIQAEARIDNQLRELGSDPVIPLRRKLRTKWAVAAAIAAGLVMMFAALSKPHSPQAAPPLDFGLYETGVQLPPHSVHDSFQGF